LPKYYYYYYVPQTAKVFRIYNVGHYDTGRKVVVSITDGVIGIVH